MNVAEWILVAFLSVALLIFLTLAIILVAILIGIAKEARKIVETGHGIAEKTEDIVENVKDMTSVGGIVRRFAMQCDKCEKTKKKGEKGRGKE